MFFLLRVGFWLTVVLALLPSGGSQPSSQAQAGATDVVVAAGAAVSDMSGFCDRQPEACVVGSQAAVAIGQRAQAGAKMVYEFINERMARSETGSLPDAKVVPASMPAAAGAHGTLQPADLAPAWRGPAPRKEAQPRKDGRQPA